ncbi:MAG TPA: hypothetical protein ENO03_01900 [Candidatus Aminicenantes bacterium]|nr:hypothetical protein [Candidatus Aminicenantes bacterium]
MRLLAVVRLRQRARALALKVRRAVVFLLVMAALAAILVTGKNILVSEVGRAVEKTFAYDSLRLSYFPPAFVIHNLRSLTDPPALRARRVRIEVPLLSILRNRKILSVSVVSPEIRVRPSGAAAPRRKARPPLSILELPFVIERGFIEDGVFVYESGPATFEARGIRALVTQDGDRFTVRATAESSAVTTPDRAGPAAIGALTLILEGRGETATVSRLSVDGPGLSLASSGLVRSFAGPAVSLDARFEIETGLLDDALDLPFAWKGRLRGEGRIERAVGGLSVSTSVASDDLAVSGVPMGAVRGRFELAPAKGGRLEVGVQKPGRAAESLILSFLDGRVDGRAAPLALDPLFRELEVPWPIKSMAWGTFTLAQRKLAAEAEFRDAELDRIGDLFAFRGGAKVGVDFPARFVTIEAPGLESSFGRLQATAGIDLRGDLEARIRGEVSNVRETREFVSLVLGEEFAFGDIRGKGYADVSLYGRSAAPSVSLRATLSPGGYDVFNAAFIEADAVLSGGVFDGRFEVEDPALKGLVRVRTAGEELEVEVRDGDGELAQILPSLAIPVVLSGRASGDFRMIQRGGIQEFTGSFASPEIKGYGQTASRVSGSLAWKDGVISFPELAMDFFGGRVEGRALVGTIDGEFDVNARGEELDFAAIVPSASGRLSLSVGGQGVFGRDRLKGLFSIKNMLLSPLDRTEARGELQIGAVGGRIELGLMGALVPGENPFQGSFSFPLSGEPFGGRVEGRISDLDLVVPWQGARGRIDFAAEIQGTDEEALLGIDLDVEAPVMPLPGFPYPVTDFVSSMRYADSALTLTSFGGKLGGGAISGSGRVGLAEGAVASMDLRLEGRDMVLAPFERMRAQADASLRVIKDSRHFVTEGEILFERLSFRREIYEPFEFSSAPGEAPEGPSFFDGMTLNIRLRGDDDVTIENSLGRFNARFDLTLAGSLDEPVLLGDLDIVSGDFYFQDRSFRVIHGRLGFTDPVTTEPYLDFRGEAYVKDFRVTLTMSGPASRLKPEFTSSPPLPPEEILSLLALGESFRRMYYSYSGDRSTALNTASLLTYQIADLAKRGAGGLFSLDRFRIDPYIPEGAPGGIAARLTVGKKISQSVLVLYSTVLASSSVRSEIDDFPIFRVEWDISRRFSLVGGQDDRGRLGIDVKFRRRF